MIVVGTVTAKMSTEKLIEARRWTPTKLPQLAHLESPNRSPLTGKLSFEQSGHLRMDSTPADGDTSDRLMISRDQGVSVYHWLSCEKHSTSPVK